MGREIEHEEIVRRNLDLLNDFMQVAIKDASLLERIPSGAHLVILPDDDPEMRTINKGVAERMVKRGEAVVVVRMERPARPKIEMELLSA
jgi:hypothetical protein